MLLSTQEQPMDTMQTIAERITKQRIARGLSQRALAEKLGISRTTLTSIERGEDGVTMGTLLKVMDFLELDMSVKYAPRIDPDNLPKRPNIFQLMAMNGIAKQ
jgi:transcriptional regulator with XRE-family HTH domain